MGNFVTCNFHPNACKMISAHFKLPRVIFQNIELYNLYQISSILNLSTKDEGKNRWGEIFPVS